MLKPGLCFTFLCCLISLLSQAGKRDTCWLRSGRTVELYPYCTVLEDSTPSLSAQAAYSESTRFKDLDSLHEKSPTDIYWVRIYLGNNDSVPRSVYLTFSNLSFVDLYAWLGRQMVLHREAGTFRPATEIEPGDGREYFSLTVPPHIAYSLYIRVYHTKHYWPALRFYSQDAIGFRAELARKQMLDLWIFGAISIFFLYSLLSWIVSFYRFYLWLLLFIAASGMYSLSMSGYFIDWFTPNSPSTGWLWNIHLIHAGTIGGLLLVMNFWNMKEAWPRIYRLFQMIIAGVIILSLVSLGIDYLTSNYRLMNSLNLVCMSLFIMTTFYGMIKAWPGLSRPGRLLGYGYAVYLSAYIIGIIFFILLQERAILPTAYLGNFSILVVIVLFSTALKEELHKGIADKNNLLSQLNKMQQEQNQVLEGLVQERTRDLQASNQALEDRNSRIETLIQELHHRVKNNLQLLYGLLSLQLPDIADPSVKDVLEKNLHRIRAMSIVNEKLFQADNVTVVDLKTFTEETAYQVGTMYSATGKVNISSLIGEGIHIPVNFAVPFGLILTELLTNSFKYALEDNDQPAVYLAIATSASGSAPGEKWLTFSYHDNGKERVTLAQPKKDFSGLSLVRDLVRQLHGTMETWYDGGLHYKFLMPV